MKADGLDLRQAVEGDVDQIADLLEARGESSDAVDLRLMVRRHRGSTASPSSSTAHVSCRPRVAARRDARACAIPAAGIELAAGQVELVATDTEYEGRGLVRALMAWAHERSAASRPRPPGHDRDPVLLPAVRLRVRHRHRPGAARQPGCRHPDDRGGRARRRLPTTCAAIDRLQDGDQASADVTMPRSAGGVDDGCSRGDSSTTWVAERDGSVVATCRASRRRRPSC